MARPAESGSRAHRSRPVHVVPAPLLAAACATIARGGPLGRSPVAGLLAPQLRGRVSPRTLRTLELKGLRVHRVGRAAYVHGRGFHWILAVRGRGEPDPFPGRLGRVSDGYRRRCERMARETRHLELERVRGRFAGRLPWQHVRPVRAYRWDPEPMTWLELVTSRAADHNHRVRVALGLEWPDGRGGSWYPEAGSALEARALDGDR